MTKEDADFFPHEQKSKRGICLDVETGGMQYHQALENESDANGKVDVEGETRECGALVCKDIDMQRNQEMIQELQAEVKISENERQSGMRGTARETNAFSDLNLYSKQKVIMEPTPAPTCTGGKESDSNSQCARKKTKFEALPSSVSTGYGEQTDRTNNSTKFKFGAEAEDGKCSEKTDVKEKYDFRSTSTKTDPHHQDTNRPHEGSNTFGSDVQPGAFRVDGIRSGSDEADDWDHPAPEYVDDGIPINPHDPIPGEVPTETTEGTETKENPKALTLYQVAEAVEPKIEPSKSFWERNLKILLVAAAIIILSATLVIIMYKRPNPDPPQQSSHISERFISIRDIVFPVLGQEKETMLEDVLSPQYQALSWIADNDDAAVPLDETKWIIQRYSLAVLFYSTAGEDWRNQYGFLSGLNECDWKQYSSDHQSDMGVAECDANFSVTKMYLVDNNLVGTLPSEVGNLKSLLHFMVFQNRIHGSLPTQLGYLNNLLELSFAISEITGTIPVELGNLTDLQYLFLDRNMISGRIPTQLGMLTDLKHLTLYKNRLSGTIPSELGNLANIEDYVFLHLNDLSGQIPTELGSFVNLTALSLGGNRLSGSIPSEFGEMQKLTFLDVMDNKLQGKIPTELWSLSNIDTLLLTNSSLDGSIASLVGKLRNVRLLNLSENRFSGKIPTEIGELHNLVGLALGNNTLTGTIPTHIGLLTNLRTFGLNFNEMTGELPSELGLLTALFRLWLHENNFNGTVPETLSNLREVTEFSVTGNSLTGTVNFLCDAWDADAWTEDGFNFFKG